MKTKTKKIETSTKKREGAETNPFGANQWHADPRQQLFLAYFLDPKRDTFGNARQSALKAGFKENYADNILNSQPEWLMEKIGNLSPMLLRAEKNMEEMLELPSKTQAMGMYGPIFQKIKERVNGKSGRMKTIVKQIPVMTYNKGLLKIKQDTSHFVAERVGRKKYGQKEPEFTPTLNVFLFANEQRNRIATRIIRGGSASDSTSESESN